MRSLVIIVRCCWFGRFLCGCDMSRLCYIFFVMVCSMTLSLFVTPWKGPETEGQSFLLFWSRSCIETKR
ncbi:unnamed protein product [Ectocarpus sp. 8 AP-2014]